MVARFLCRVLTELVSKMRDMQMDKTELGCLRAIVLFNPGTASPGPQRSRPLRRGAHRPSLLARGDSPAALFSPRL